MTIPVWFLTLPGVMTLDMAGPAETLRLACRDVALYYTGPDATVFTSTRMTLSNILPLPERLPSGSILIVPGLENSQHQLTLPAATEACLWLRHQQAAIHRGK
ncbi:Uncharacterised protein [Tatumella ptyseos]|uniref:Uncharacterized protein n=1 Tax=Tatumella ptyseos TaxID=82987 RepID=A0A2X5NUE9_9GAMM|nr:Uncharacterised protein [Tatumella ptyseos]